MLRLRDRLLAGFSAPLMAALLLSAGFVLVLTLVYCRPAVVYHDMAENLKMARVMCDRLHGDPTGLSDISTAGMPTPFNRNLYRYPPGYSLMVVIPYMIWGSNGMFLASPLILFLTLIAFYHLCSRMVGGWTAVLSLLFLAAIPSVTMNLIWGSTHLPTVLLILVTLIFLERWMSARRTADALLCGFTAGLIPLVRNPEITVTLAAGVVFLVAVISRRPRSWMHLLMFCLSALVPLAILAYFNKASFSSPITTGYEATGEQGAFSTTFFINNIVPYMQLIMSECGAHIMLMAVFGIALMWKTAGRRLTALAIVLITVITILLYSFYYWDPRTSGVRFMLPCLFLVVLAAAFFLRRLQTILPRKATPVAAAAVLLSMLNALPHYARTLPSYAAASTAVQQVSATVLTCCAPGEILFADIVICTTLDVTGDYSLIGYSMAESGTTDWTTRLSETYRSVGDFCFLGQSTFIDTLDCFLPKGTRMTGLASIQIAGAGDHRLTVLQDLNSLSSLMDMNITYMLNSRDLELVRIESTSQPRKKPPRVILSAA